MARVVLKIEDGREMLSRILSGNGKSTTTTSRDGPTGFVGGDGGKCDNTTNGSIELKSSLSIHDNINTHTDRFPGHEVATCGSSGPRHFGRLTTHGNLLELLVAFITANSYISSSVVSL